jgi:type III pantothenate kinase
MLLAVDVGNTNIVLGIFKEEGLKKEWRIGTDRAKTADEYGVLIHTLFASAGIAELEIRDIIISSVVPPMLNTLEELCMKYFTITPLIVEPGIRTGMPIIVDNPREVGADRIVNAVAAYHRYKGPCIVVDFGTATTFDCISGKGEYLGGVIVPGIVISKEALSKAASKLPTVEIVRPRTVIGKNTVHSMQSGIFFGYVELVDGLVERIRKEIQENTSVIATGGLANLVASESRTIQDVDIDLTLKGLQILYQMNRKEDIP